MAFNRSSAILPDLKILPCPPTYCQCETVLNSIMCVARYYYGKRHLQCHPHRTGMYTYTAESHYLVVCFR